MSVLLETSIGDLTIDLHCHLAPKATQNFLKLCAVKYYNDVCFHRVQKGFIIECGDPSLPLGVGPATVSAATAAASVAAAATAAAAAAASTASSSADSAPAAAAAAAPPSARPASTRGGDSIWGLLYGPQARCFPCLPTKALTHAKRGCVSMMPATGTQSLHASTFLITLTDGLGYLDASCTPIGQVVEGLEAFIAALDGILLSAEGVPAQNIRIRHTLVLEDPTPSLAGMDALVPPVSPVPIVHPFDVEVLAEEDAREAERAVSLSAEALEAERLAKEARSKAVVLEMLGDLPDADAEPPPNVLFVCKLNSCTRSSDLELIFSRFGGLKACDIITDPKTGASLQYAFLEFDTPQACEQAYFKMNNTLIDERRIKVDFSQSVSKQWNQFRRNKMQKIKAAQKPTTTAIATQQKVPAATAMMRAPAAPQSSMPPPAAAAAASAPAPVSPSSAAASGESSRPHHDRHRSRSPGRHPSSSSSSSQQHHRSSRDDSRDRSSSHHHGSSSSHSGSSHRDRHEEDRHRSRRDDERSGSGHSRSHAHSATADSSSSSRRDRSRSRSRDRDRKHRERSRSPRRSEHSSSDRSRDRR